MNLAPTLGTRADLEMQHIIAQHSGKHRYQQDLAADHCLQVRGPGCQPPESQPYAYGNRKLRSVEQCLILR